MDKKAKIDLETLNRVLDYLADKPFREVHHLIKLIQEAVVITEPDNIDE